MKKTSVILAFLFIGAGVMAQFSETPMFETRLTCPGSVAFGDLNGDGVADMLISTYGEGWNGEEAEILVYLNRNGSYAAAPDKRIPFPHCYSITVHDFDEDGENDIGVVSGKHICFLLNKHGFDPAKQLKFFNTNQCNGGVQVCKINEEGSFDILRGPVWRKFFLRDGSFSVKNGYILGPQINDTWETEAVDINNDNVMDIVGSGRKDNTVRIYYGPLLNLSVYPEQLSDFLQIEVAGYLSTFAVADLDGDGLKDLIISDAKNNKTHIYLQNQPVGFDADATPSITINGGARAYTEDLNGDSLPDLIVLSNDHTTVSVFLQKSDASIPADIKAADQQLSIRKSGALYFEDINNDGRKDMLAKGSYGHIQIYPGVEAVSSE